MVALVSPSLLLVGGCVNVRDEAGRQESAPGFSVDPGLPALVGLELLFWRHDGRVE
jgi:hypothetical protein